MEQFEASEVAAGKAIAAGEASQDATALAFGYNPMATRQIARGELEQALRLNDRAMAAFEAGARPDFDVDPYVIRAYCLVGLDRLEEADDILARSVWLNQQAGGAFLSSSYFFRARLRFLQGRWDDALAELEAGLDVPDPYLFAPALRSLMGLIAIHRGTRTPGAGGAGGPEFGLGSRVLGFVTLWQKALAAETQAQSPQALALLYPAWGEPAGLQPRRVIYEICPDLARLAAATGDTAKARELATTTETLAARAPSPSMDATALLCRGLADGEADPLLAAARSFHQAGRPLYEGYAYELAAGLLAERGRTTEARDPLDRALALYAELGAAWDSARAEARLRQAGVRRGRCQSLPKRPVFGWEALTATESKVAALVAEGRSNPDIATQMFLSRRTVQSHVSSILTKLQLDSRAELQGQTGTGQPPRQPGAPGDPGPDNQPAERVFLCHCSEDKEQIRDLYRRLQRDGLQPWLDEEDILGGQRWESEIRHAINRSRYVLVCLSENFVTRRGYVQKEIAYALDVAYAQPERSTFLIPVRLELCKIPPRLRARQCADLFAPNGYTRLLHSLRRGRSRQG